MLHKPLNVSRPLNFFRSQKPPGVGILSIVEGDDCFIVTRDENGAPWLVATGLAGAESGEGMRDSEQRLGWVG